MPMVDFMHPQGAIKPEALATAVDKLTAAFLRHEGAPQNERIRAIAWTYDHEMPSGSIYTDGKPADAAYCKVQISVPEGTLLHGPGSFRLMARRNLIREPTPA